MNEAGAMAGCTHPRLKGRYLPKEEPKPWSPLHNLWRIGDVTECWECGATVTFGWWPIATADERAQTLLKEAESLMERLRQVVNQLPSSQP